MAEGCVERHLLLYSLVGIQSIWFPVARGLLHCCFLLWSWLLFQILGFLHLLHCYWFYISLSICNPLLKFGLLFFIFVSVKRELSIFSVWNKDSILFIFPLIPLTLTIVTLSSLFFFCISSWFFSPCLLGDWGSCYHCCALFLWWLVYCLVYHPWVSTWGCWGWFGPLSAGGVACILAGGIDCTMAGGVDCTLADVLGYTLAGGVAFTLTGGVDCTLADGVDCTLAGGASCHLAGGVGYMLVCGVACTFAGGGYP